MKQFSNFVIFVTIVAVGFLFSYLTIGFVIANFDYTQWPETQRVYTLFFTFAYTLILLAWYLGGLE